MLKAVPFARRRLHNITRYEFLNKESGKRSPRSLILGRSETRRWSGPDKLRFLAQFFGDGPDGFDHRVEIRDRGFDCASPLLGPCRVTAASAR
jgi:hypothetical protein